MTMARPRKNEQLEPTKNTKEEIEAALARACGQVPQNPPIEMIRLRQIHPLLNQLSWVRKNQVPPSNYRQ